jgi:hypothetical protein
MARTDPVGFGPVRRIGLHREVERRLLAVGGGDGVRKLGAVSALPARHQPARGVERDGVSAAQLLCGALCDLAQHGVDQPRIARIAPIRLHQPHREVDRRMVGHLEPQDLRGADQQRGLDPR